MHRRHALGSHNQVRNRTKVGYNDIDTALESGSLLGLAREPVLQEARLVGSEHYDDVAHRDVLLDGDRIGYRVVTRPDHAAESLLEQKGTRMVLQQVGLR